MNKEFIAYDGDQFTIEWYFNNKGKSIPLEYFEKLSKEDKKKIIHLFFLLGDDGKILNKEKFRHEGDKIYAIKSFTNRLLCFFFNGSKIIITSAYEKKSQKMPIKEKIKAVKIRQDYEKRCKEGNYYE
ncbi:MAG: hypothetical protein UR12_C0008G0029 [candidate division TM6 bacterium GW2011_GWF2_30_66]|jgi:hypothetical protein|nr:MAG: hypothetical protein UR12_C0008G0029 [candidate division TM6 bacterium GW2011_GWF2_30_66]